MLPDGSDARVPLTEGNCAPELLTAGNDEDCELPPEDGDTACGAAADDPLTDGNGEAPLGWALPATGGKAPCAHADPTGAASTVRTTGTKSPRTITFISFQGDVLRPATRLNNLTISAATRRNAARSEQNC
jgi:hypothetical protein